MLYVPPLPHTRNVKYLSALNKIFHTVKTIVTYARKGLLFCKDFLAQKCTRLTFDLPVTLKRISGLSSTLFRFALPIQTLLA